MRTAQHPMRGGRAIKAALHLEGDAPRLLTLAVGYTEGGVADLVDLRAEDRLVLPAAALPLLRLPQVTGE